MEDEIEHFECPETKYGQNDKFPKMAIMATDANDSLVVMEAEPSLLMPESRLSGVLLTIPGCF